MGNINYEKLLEILKTSNSNMLVLGKAGAGKSYLIKELCKTREDIILGCPTGIAAMNINGRTLDSIFCIKQNSIEYTFPKMDNYGILLMLKSNILLIDEISMVKLNTLDNIDKTLKIIKRNEKPFGGLRLLFFGDMMQLEPIVGDYEMKNLIKEYVDFNGDAGFYNAKVMKENNFFKDAFEIYFLKHNFRQQKDVDFQDILDEVREGKISSNTIKTLNKQYVDNFDYFQLHKEGYHILTLTNKTAMSINKEIIDKLPGDTYTCYPKTACFKKFEKRLGSTRINNIINIKVGLKVMFVVNDTGIRRRWANGTMGTIEEINHDDEGKVKSVTIKIKKGKYNVIYDVKKIRVNIDGLVNGLPEEVGYVVNFPFVPSLATTIHKMQGMTLEKAAIILDSNIIHPNLMYVALSRVGELKNLLILGRKLLSSDMITSEKIFNFLDSIESRIQNVFYELDNKVNAVVSGVKKKIIVKRNILSA